ncbi:hypothetical protein PV325_001940 [Microctonus aethiopoides]|uniref:KICSTOR complex protein kaptin-like n=1 Tax=Microctonus aethiopoides TaxID=144406 RepID=A0AA39FY89_9HYME|nr:hypothetical protein PV325_001940 [Microctonus aethiopoides]KAK0177695.1 hypothetical protein PV328_001723 [Microctonus aethiopoides]
MNELQTNKYSLRTMINIHWFPLASQGNVYSMSKLCSSHGTNKILVASLKRKIFSCGYQLNENNTLRPLVKELLFTYIPSGAEIISIDAYNKQHYDEDFVIGITIIKPNSEGRVETYLNIYSEGAGEIENAETSIETIAQNCLTVELTYTPYLLYHTSIRDEEIGEEVVWLISGDDNQLHMIREDKLSHGYTEFQLDKYFPELINLETLVLWINVYYYDNGKRRLTAVACECGLVKISMINVENLEIIHEWMLRYDKPVTSVQIFPQHSDGMFYSFSDNVKTTKDESTSQPIINILVVTALDPAIVFMDVLRHKLRKDVILRLGDTTECLLSSYIADVNMDGNNEILLGTYTQEIVVFTLIKNQWQLTDRRKFDAPIHSMCYLDLTGDGVRELVVLTQRGVYILQHDPKYVNQLWTNRLKKLMQKSCNENKIIEK